MITIYRLINEYEELWPTYRVHSTYLGSLSLIGVPDGQVNRILCDDPGRILGWFPRKVGTFCTLK